MNQEQWHAAQVAYNRLVSSRRPLIHTIRIDEGEHGCHVEVMQLIKDGDIGFILQLIRLRRGLRHTLIDQVGDLLLRRVMAVGARLQMIIAYLS